MPGTLTLISSVHSQSSFLHHNDTKLPLMFIMMIPAAGFMYILCWMCYRRNIDLHSWWWLGLNKTWMDRNNESDNASTLLPCLSSTPLVSCGHAGPTGPLICQPSCGHEIFIDSCDTSWVCFKKLQSDPAGLSIPNSSAQGFGNFWMAGQTHRDSFKEGGHICNSE